MARDKLIYREVYKAGASVLTTDLPTVRHFDGEAQPVAMEVRASGKIERAGTKLEYQDIRLYFKGE